MHHFIISSFHHFNIISLYHWNIKMEIFRFFVHYGMHFVLPFIIAFIFYRKSFWKVSLLILSANLIDLDHLLATPIFDPSRCSIGFHPLHSYYAIAFYAILFLFPRTRIISIGLLLHLITDLMDCLW